MQVVSMPDTVARITLTVNHRKDRLPCYRKYLFRAEDNRGRVPFSDESGTLTSQRYRDEILAPYVRLFYGVYGPNFIFADDNAFLHKARFVD
ncbi:hypothetical protein TNCV_2867531 [Trichonephila clavipes]|nr:hypothetical protein TNCV_2867531 [Trichonephila clavipes]